MCLFQARRESILQKAEERVARYEAWKAGGRKGGRGHVLGFGSATPRDICQPIERPRRSSSHSALQRRSPNGSDVDSVRPQRRAISACSAVRRHIDNNRIGMLLTQPLLTSLFSHLLQIVCIDTMVPRLFLLLLFPFFFILNGLFCSKVHAVSVCL